MVFTCALLAAVCVSYLVYRMVSGQPSAAAAQPVVQVVVAARDLETGTLIREVDVKSASWTVPIPKRAILQRANSVGRGVVAKIYEGEPITEDRVAAIGSGAGLAVTIPPGMRACAVRVNEVAGLAGFVIPGMRVDVLITGVRPGTTVPRGPEARTLLQNIQVLSAGANFQKDDQGKPQQVQVVNLMVTPSQAEILSLASEAHVQLVLRNPMDREISRPPGTMMAELYGELRAPIPGETASPSDGRPVRRPPLRHPREKGPAGGQDDIVRMPHAIEVFNGSKRTETLFKRVTEKP